MFMVYSPSLPTSLSFYECLGCGVADAGLAGHGFGFREVEVAWGFGVCCGHFRALECLLVSPFGDLASAPFCGSAIGLKF